LWIAFGGNFLSVRWWLINLDVFPMNKARPDPSNPLTGPSEPVVSRAGVEPDDDATFVTRAQSGDLRAYDELVIRHRGRIFAMVRNMIHNEADAWDLSQEVFVKAWQALPKFEAKARFSTWLFRIAHNVVYDWTRKRKIESAGEFNDEIFDRDQIDPQASTAPSGAEAPDASMEHGELRLKIQTALFKLSPEHRESVVLKDVQGLSYKEIADAMDCSIGTVMSRLFYARQKLQALLKDEYDAR
jgi:RNA polymerase sigma-70 factor (ECF subfamily)